ncbi:MAG: hypothetical protein ACK53Y_21665, partial [bacterium]
GQDSLRKHHHVDSTTPREIQKTPMPDSASTTRFSLRSSPNPYETASLPDIPCQTPITNTSKTPKYDPQKQDPQK